MHKFLRVAGSIVGALVLGALGSGLWEKVMSPALSAASAATVAAISSVSATYRDSIYERAAKDISDLYTMKVAFLIIIIAGIVLTVSVASRFFANADIRPALRSRVHKLVSLNSLSLGLALVAVGFFSLARVDAAAQIKEKSLRSLEIARPAIGEVEYVRLRARFYSVTTKSEFDTFRLTLQQQAEIARIRIPLSELPSE